MERITSRVVSRGSVIAAFLILAFWVSARAERRSVEGIFMDVPSGWTMTRGAGGDGQLGYLLEAPGMSASGDEAFLLYVAPLPFEGVEAAVRLLQTEAASSGQFQIERSDVVLFRAQGHPGARADLVSSDAEGRLRYYVWVVAKDPAWALVLRATVYDRRVATIVSALEGFVRSWRFPEPYPDGGASLEGGGGATPPPVVEEPSEPGRAIRLEEFSGKYCMGDWSRLEEYLEFSGKGQWEKKSGNVPPSEPAIASGFCRVEGRRLVLKPFSGEPVHCHSPVEDVLSCEGKRYEKGLCP